MYPAAFVLKTQQTALYDTRKDTLYTGTGLLEAPGPRAERDTYGMRGGGVGAVLVALFAFVGYAAVLPF